jgi:hypothetical protein
MTDAENLPSDHPVLALGLTAAVGAVGYVLPTAVFGRPVEPLPTVLFAVAFAVLYMGAVFLEDRIPDL